MKKLLTLVSLGFLATNGLSVANSTYHKIDIENLNYNTLNMKKAALPVPIITARQAYFQLPACIQMLLGFFNVKFDSQYDIFDSLGGNIGDELPFDSAIANYLQMRIINQPQLSYQYQAIPNHTLDEIGLFVFQTAIAKSIEQGIPVMIGYASHDIFQFRREVITDIEVSTTNSALTRIRIIDSIDGHQYWRQLSDFQTLSNLGIIASGLDQFDFTQKTIKINSWTDKTDQWNGTIYGNHQELSETVDLKQQANITTYNQFIKIVKYISLDQLTFNFKYTTKSHKEYDILNYNYDFMPINKINDGWSDWIWVPELSKVWTEGVKGFIDTWYGTKTIILPNGNFGLNISYRNNSIFPFGWILTNLSFNMGKIWTLHF